MSSQTPTPSPSGLGATGGIHFGRLFLIAIVLTLIAGGIYLAIYSQNNPTPQQQQAAALRGYLQDHEKFTHLAEGYLDEDKNLVADPPKDGKFLMPTELYFTEVAGDDPEKLAKTWEPFRKHLEAKTGLPVKYLAQLDPPAETPPVVPAKDDQGDPRENEDRGPPLPTPVRSFSQQIDLIKTGKLHVAAFSTGQVPIAVNTAGFVPLFAPATSDGNFSYDMEVIVPADSPVKEMKDLKGKTIAFVSMSSNSGAKAPIVLFQDKYDLRVDRDYQFTITGSHQRSALGVCIGQNATTKPDASKKPGPRYEAACVASDMLARMVANGTVKADQYRSIHKEGPFPVLCFGVPHNLAPDLVAKVKDAFVTFPFEGTTVGEKYKSSDKVKFAPVDYKKDWQNIRDIDAKLPQAINGK